MAAETALDTDGGHMTHRMPAAARRLVIISLVNQLGSGAFAGVLVLFFIRFLRLPENTTNTLLSLAAGVGLASLVPMGFVADRVGLGRMLRIACAASFLAAATLAFMRGPVFAGICYVLLVLCDRACNVSRNGLLPTLVTGPDAPRLKARVRSMSNLGYGLGAALAAGVLIVLPTNGFVVALLLNAFSYAGCAILAGGLDRDRSLRRSSMVRKPGADGRYICFVAVNGALSLHLPLFELILPMLIVTHFDGPAWLPGVCLAVNTAAIVLGQTTAARSINGWLSSVRAARVGTVVALAGLCLMTAGASLGQSWLVAAAIVGTVVHVIGEMRGVAGQWELQMGFAPHGAQGRYQATNALGLGGARMAAPWLVALMLASTWTGMAVVALILLVAVAAMGPVARWVRANRADFGGVAPEFGG